MLYTVNQLALSCPVYSVKHRITTCSKDLFSDPVIFLVFDVYFKAHMALSEVFPALTAAQKSIALNPLWWIGYQTLGRAHLGLGEVRTVSVELP